jgi:hypothetical protein
MQTSITLDRCKENKMNNHILQLSAAAALLIATPSIASAQTIGYGNAAPVAINSCSFTASGAPRNLDTPLAFGGPVSFAGPQTADTIALGYVSHGNVPATAVRIVVSDGTFTQDVTAKGNFAPGAQIEKTFGADRSANVDANATCSVAEVRFADGTSWHAIREVANH